MSPRFPQEIGVFHIHRHEHRNLPLFVWQQSKSLAKSHLYPNAKVQQKSEISSFLGKKNSRFFYSYEIMARESLLLFCYLENPSILNC